MRLLQCLFPAVPDVIAVRLVSHPELLAKVLETRFEKDKVELVRQEARKRKKAFLEAEEVHKVCYAQRRLPRCITRVLRASQVLGNGREG